jgi:choline dehydrogenase-like flavoprotein
VSNSLRNRRFLIKALRMIIQSSALDFATSPRPDVLIVGSGPVGLALAVALEKRGRTVTILEAGEQFLNDRTQSDLQGDCSGAALPGLVVGRARQVGGGLNLWGGQLALLEDDDLLRGDTESEMRWPITRNDLYAGLDDVLEMLDNDKIDLSAIQGPVEQESAVAHQYGLKLFQTGWLKHPKLTRAFWRQLRQTSSIRLIYNLTCVGLDYDAATERVNSVVAIGRSGQPTFLSANTIVLAAGSIESARLLLLPTANGVSAPWHDSPWLGCGFSEHIDATTAEIEIINHSRLNDIFDPVVNHGWKYTPKVTWTKSRRTGSALSACGMLVWPGYRRNAVSELISLGSAVFARGHVEHISMLPKAASSTLRQIMPLVYRYVTQRRIGSFTDRNAYLRVSTEQPVRQQSKIMLSTSAQDRHGVPRVVVNWIRGDEELNSLKEFTAAVQCWLEGEGIAKVHGDPRLKASDLAFLDDANDGLHHSGTTRMGASPKSSVVNSGLRVHGVKNLFVCGASVFPSSGYANPTLTAMALAFRLARTISAERRPC